MKHMRLTLFMLILGVGFSAPAALNAALVAPCTGQVPGVEGTVCTLCDLFKTGQNILNFMVSPQGGLVFVLSVIGIMIGGILILVSGANQQLYAKGVFALKAAVTGLAIALAAWVIINTILVALTGSQQPQGFPWPWNEVRCQ
jgi:hypothetical protein